MGNLDIYNALRTPPEEALSIIENGRMKGKTDINPMWRIKALTEQFGPCGIGWRCEITRQWIEPGADGVISAFCNILLYFKYGDTWSEGIPGTGGSAFVAKERNGLYTSDECYKMALTDALSVACKMLGMAGDIYWQNDPTKYNKDGQSGQGEQKPVMCNDCGKPIKDGKKRDGSPWPASEIVTYSMRAFSQTLCPACQRAAYEKIQRERTA